MTPQVIDIDAFPWATSLRPYQRQAAAWLVNRPPYTRGRILALAVGMGKTRVLLAAIRAREEVRRTGNGSGDATSAAAPLVICPAMAIGDWRNECKIFWPEKTMRVIGEKGTATEDEIAAALAGRNGADTAGSAGAALIASSYARIGRIITLAPQLLGDLVVDEIHHAKKDRTLRASLLRPLVARAAVSHFASGTPIHNRVPDLWNILDLCKPGAFGGRFQFAARYCQVHTSAFGSSIGRLLDPAGLARDTENFIYSCSERDAFGELPPRIVSVVPVEGRLAEGDLFHPGDVALSRPEAERRLRRAVPTKIPTVIDLALHLDEPLLVYAYERAHVQAIAAKLIDAGVTVLVATGASSPAKRDKIIAEWRSGAARILCATLDAVQESTTLCPPAYAMIFADFDWLFGKMVQVMGRIDPARVSENLRRPVRYYLVAVPHGFDEVIAERLCEKALEAHSVIRETHASSALATALDTVAPKRETDSDALADVLVRMESRAARIADLGVEAP